MNSGRAGAFPIMIRICRVGMGIVLLIAALGKIGDVATFARQIGNYHAIPGGLENLLAIVLPWIELLAGLALLLGVHARAGAWLATGLMVVFTIAVAQAMARGLDIECGCFGTADATRVGGVKLFENLVFTAAAAVGSLRLR